MILKPHNADFGSSPFCFFNSWSLNNIFNLVFENGWGNFHGFDAPDPHMLTKIKFLKDEIRKWRNEATFKELGTLRVLREKVDSLDTSAESRLLSSVECTTPCDAMVKI